MTDGTRSKTYRYFIVAVEYPDSYGNLNPQSSHLKQTLGLPTKKFKLTMVLSLTFSMIVNPNTDEITLGSSLGVFTQVTSIQCLSDLKSIYML